MGARGRPSPRVVIPFARSLLPLGGARARSLLSAILSLNASVTSPVPPAPPPIRKSLRPPPQASRARPAGRPRPRALSTAGTVRAEQARNGAGLDGERNTLQHVRLVVGGSDLCDLEPACHSCHPEIGFLHL